MPSYLKSADEVNEIMEFCKQAGLKMAEYLVDAGCDIIAVVDPITSQIDLLAFVKEIALKKGISSGGKMKLTVALLWVTRTMPGKRRLTVSIWAKKPDLSFHPVTICPWIPLPKI